MKTDNSVKTDNRDFIIQFRDGTYYSRNVHWRGVGQKSKATWLTRQRADKVKSHLNRHFDMGASIIPKE